MTTVSLALLVRLRVGLNYSAENLLLMLAIYALAALPFFAGGAVITLAVSRLSGRINQVYASDLLGASAGCLLLLPLLDRVGAPGVVLATASLGAAAALLFTGGRSRVVSVLAALLIMLPWGAHLAGVVSFDVQATKGHEKDKVLFSKWNSFSRIGVYDRRHGDWSLSPTYHGPVPDTRFMDIDSAASTPIIAFSGNLEDVGYLRSELTALAYYLAPERFSALVIGPGGGRDLLSALVFGARRVDGVEINPIIARDVMMDRFRAFSGGLYLRPDVRVYVEDGRSFVRRSPERYDIIQASLVDTWAATAAGAYTLDREQPLHRRGVPGLPRSPVRPRCAHDHAVGPRRRPPRVARAGSVCAPGPRPFPTPCRHPAREGGDLHSEEVPVHPGGGGAPARDLQPAALYAALRSGAPGSRRHCANRRRPLGSGGGRAERLRKAGD